MAAKPSNPLKGMSNEDILAIAERITLLRHDILHMKQSQFAKCIDISQTYLSLIENKKKPVNYDTILRIASSFGASIDWMLQGGDESLIFKHRKTNESYLKKKLCDDAIDSMQVAYSLRDRDTDFIRWLSELPIKERSAFLDAVDSLRRLPGQSRITR